MHSSQEVAPEDAWNCPGKHDWHPVVPVLGWKVPAEQLSQVADLTEEANFPGSQDEQEVPS